MAPKKPHIVFSVSVYEEEYGSVVANSTLRYPLEEAKAGITDKMQEDLTVVVASLIASNRVDRLLTGEQSVSLASLLTSQLDKADA